MRIDLPSIGHRLTRLVGSPVDHNIDPYRQLVAAIASREADLTRLGDVQLQERAQRLRDRVRSTADIEDGSLVDGFALTREAARRVLGQRPYDVQMVAGIALHRGRAVEMATGEGKTLAAVAPAFLDALAGRGVHVLTFNDYLARRDAGWMGPVYRFLGLDVGFVQEDMSTAERRRAYGCDVSYVTAKEAGFDHLRGFLATTADEVVHRPFHFAIVDEADSLLVDEARVPLVIAGHADEVQTNLNRLADLAASLRRGFEYDTDEYARNVNLTENGCNHIEHELGVGNLYAEDNLLLLAQIRNALHAHALLRRDVDYIVRQGRVELVDEHTGRVAERRHWPDGLQAAVEAKEGLAAQPEGAILGSMTLQHFLLSYPKLAGMTATAQPAAAELAEFYGLDIQVVRTHLPCIRVDHDDVVFTHLEAKLRDLVAEIERVHDTGQPILVGTASVAESEELADRLWRIGVACRVLNAANDELEAEIVAEAGAPGAVTISTNMAGRGTDIRLGGQDEVERNAVVAVGGLYVIGTNRHESLRIDNQLRGRAGRQGDPGSSRFFISLEDDLVVRYGLLDMVPAASRPAPQNGPVDDRLLRREIARAQRIVDGQNFEARKTLWKYSCVVDAQRTFLHDWRQSVLHDEQEFELLAARAAAKYQRLLPVVGGAVLRDVEKHITLLTIDRCWSDYLAEIARIRDGIHLVTLGGKAPYEEFHSAAREAFHRLLERVDDDIVAAFEAVEVTADGVDWAREGLRGPSSTWTYLVTDTPFRSDPLAAIAGRQSIGAVHAFTYAPLWLAWFFLRLWQTLRRRRGGP